MAIVNLQEFEKLLRRSEVSSKVVPWYLLRVEGFVSAREEPDSRIESEEVEAHLSRLSREVEDWQVEQAREGIRLYRYFIEEKRTPCEPDDEKSHVLDAEWKKLADETVRLLRLKHRSSH